MSEQEGGTLLSSITVLSDSIHIGSMSPSNTTHLGPVWHMFACSRISDENKPNPVIEEKRQNYRVILSPYDEFAAVHVFFKFC